MGFHGAALVGAAFVEAVLVGVQRSPLFCNV